MKDLPASTQFSNVLIFADDTKCFEHIKSSIGTERLQQDLDSISQWSKNNCLRFNAFKSTVLKFKLKSPDEDDKFYHNSANKETPKP